MLQIVLCGGEGERARSAPPPPAVLVYLIVVSMVVTG